MNKLIKNNIGKIVWSIIQVGIIVFVVLSLKDSDTTIGGGFDIATITVLLAVLGVGITMYSVFDRKAEDTRKEFRDTTTVIEGRTYNTSNKMASMEGYFNAIQKDNTHNNISKTNSPEVLNEKGLALLEKVNGRAYLNTHFDNFKKEFEGIDNRLEVSIKAEELLKTRTKDMLATIDKEGKDYMHENNFTVEHLARALSLRLRDMVIEKKGL